MRRQLTLFVMTALISFGLSFASSPDSGRVSIPVSAVSQVKVNPKAALKPLSGLSDLLDNGVLRILVLDDSLPPAIIYKNHQLSGFDISLGSRIAKELSLKPKFLRVKSYFGLIHGINQGLGDIALSDISCTAHRAKYILFSTAYRKFDMTLLANRLKVAKLYSPRHDVAEFNEKGVRIAVFRHSSYERLAKHVFPKASLVYYSNLHKMYHDLRQGKVYAMLTDSQITRHLIKDNVFSAVQFESIKLHGHVDNICVAINPNEPALRVWLNVLIRNLNDSGQMNKIMSPFTK